MSTTTGADRPVTLIPTAPAAATDPVLVEVIGSALSSIVDEMTEALVRAAYSSNIKERRDCTSSLFDASGQLIADASPMPIHLGSLMGIVQEITRRHPIEEMREGDTFIGNDPFSGGGSHLPDIVLASPVFVDGKLTAWVANIAHHADFGDRGHAHIYQEGLRIPPVRLARAWEIQQDVLDLILLNCQVPDERRADFRAQLAANRLGAQRFAALCDRYGRQTLLDATNALLDYTERMTRAGIAEIPDGTYSFSDVFDCPELDEDLHLRVKIDVRGDEIWFDFAGNPAQVRASVNMVWTALYASVFYVVKALVGPDIPSNSGAHRPIHIDAPLGSVINAQAPAAVNGRVETAQRVIDVMFGALAEALPERATGAHNGAITGVHFSGVNPRTGKYYVYLETFGGGFGARATKDGLDGVQVHAGNTSNLPVEAVESEYPLMVEAYELVEDSGGAGRTRGGLGLHRRLRVLEGNAEFWLDGSRLRSGPWGIFGGQPGGRLDVQVSEGVPAIDHGRTTLSAGQTVSIRTAGAGGYGDPRERAPELVRRDVREGKVSPPVAREVYGVEDA